MHAKHSVDANNEFENAHEQIISLYFVSSSLFETIERSACAKRNLQRAQRATEDEAEKAQNQIGLACFVHFSCVYIPFIAIMITITDHRSQQAARDIANLN